MKINSKIKKWIKNRKKQLIVEGVLCVILAITVGMNNGRDILTHVEAEENLTNNIPWLNEKLGTINNNGYYIIDSIEDLYAIQEYSKYNTCRGLKFEVDNGDFLTKHKLYVGDSVQSEPITTNVDANNKITPDSIIIDNGDDLEGAMTQYDGVPYQFDLIKYADPNYLWSSDLNNYTWVDRTINYDNSTEHFYQSASNKDDTTTIYGVDGKEYRKQSILLKTYKKYSYNQDNYTRTVKNNEKTSELKGTYSVTQSFAKDGDIQTTQPNKDGIYTETQRYKQIENKEDVDKYTTIVYSSPTTEIKDKGQNRYLTVTYNITTTEVQNTTVYTKTTYRDEVTTYTPIKEREIITEYIRDENGNIIREDKIEGDYKKDENGNYVFKKDEYGNIIYERSFKTGTPYPATPAETSGIDDSKTTTEIETTSKTEYLCLVESENNTDVYYQMAKKGTNIAITAKLVEEITGDEIKIANPSSTDDAAGYYIYDDNKNKTTEKYEDGYYKVYDRDREKFSGDVFYILTSNNVGGKEYYKKYADGLWYLVKPSEIEYNAATGKFYKNDILDYKKEKVKLDIESLFVGEKEYVLEYDSVNKKYLYKEKGGESNLDIKPYTVIGIKEKSFDEDSSDNTESTTRYFKYMGDDTLQSFGEGVYIFEQVDNAAGNRQDVIYEKDKYVKKNGDTYDVRQLPRDKVWYGIGMNPEFPFEGEIDFHGSVIRTNTNLFGILGNGAVIKNVTVFGVIDQKKNKSYYQDQNITCGSSRDTISLGAIASIVLLEKENSAPVNTNGDVILSACTVVTYETQTTKKEIQTKVTNNTKGSVGGLIGTVVTQYDSSKAHGTETNPSTLVIDGCNTQADVFSSGGNQYNVTYSEDKISSVDKNTIFSNNSYNVGYAGGMIGSVYSVRYDKQNHLYDYVRVIFKNANLVATTLKAYDSDSSRGIRSTNSYAGGVIGFIGNCVDVKFEGAIRFTTSNYATYYLYNGKDNNNNNINHNHDNCTSGLLIGDAMYSSVSVSTSTSGGYSITRMPERKSGNEDINDRIPEIGSGVLGVSSNVYVNLSGTQNTIAGDGTAESPYQLSDRDDWMTFARFLSSRGYFESSAFNVPNNITDMRGKFDYVRKAEFKITASVELLASQTGIFSFNRDRNTAFAGKIYGTKGSEPTVTFTVNEGDTRQNKIAFFRVVEQLSGNDVAFKDFKLAGTIKSHNSRTSRHACGLIMYLYQTKYNKNTIIFSNIENGLSLTANNHDANYNNDNAIIGGVSTLIGVYNCSGSNSVIEASDTGETDIASFNNIKVAGSINSTYSCVGGLVGQLKTNSSNTPKNTKGGHARIDIENVSITANIESSQGQAAGTICYIPGNNYYETKNIKVKNIDGNLSDVSTDGERMYYSRIKLNIKNFSAGSTTGTDYNSVTIKSRYGCGYIGSSWTGVDCSIDGVELNHCTLEYTNTTNNKFNVGGLIRDTSYSIYDIKNIKYNYFNILTKGNDVGGIFGNVGSTCYIDVDMTGSSITNCKVNTLDYNPIAARSEEQNYNRVRYSVVNIKGSNASGYYNMSNYYPYAFKYVNGTNTSTNAFTGAGCRLRYNIYSTNNTNKYTATPANYNITGAGTKESPFILDTPEKLVILDAFLGASPSIMETLLKYFPDVNGSGTSNVEQNVDKINTIISGYYLFTKDIDLSNYSFYSLQIYGGQYMGFKINDFNDRSNKSDKCSDTLKSEDAIETLLADSDYIANDDNRITQQYEKYFASAYNDLTSSVSSDDYKAPNHNTDTINTVETKMKDSGHSEVITNYYNLQAIKEYKPQITFNSVSIVNNAGNKIYASPVSNNTNDTVCASEAVRNLHSGLFCNIVGGANTNETYHKNFVFIDNFKLTGSISGATNNHATVTNSFVNNGINDNTYNTKFVRSSGALVTFTSCRYYDYYNNNNNRINLYQSYGIYGANVNIYNIDLDSIKVISSGGNDTYTETITGSNKKKDSGTGLLIDSINGQEGYKSSVNVDGIKTYGTQVNASSLIGCQTGAESSVEYNNINLNSVFKIMSTEKKKCSCCDEEFDINELNYSKEVAQLRHPFCYNLDQGSAVYWYTSGDYEDTILHPDEFTPALQNTHGKYSCHITYSNYVGGNSALFVPNPATFNIEHGDGTYDNPYVIENEGQLLTLASLFTINSDVAYNTTWFVGEINGCEGYIRTNPDTWPDNNKVTWEKKDALSDNADFKYLQTAYYAIVYDLDLDRFNSSSQQALLNLTSNWKYIAADGNEVAIPKTDIDYLKDNYLSANKPLFENASLTFTGIGADGFPFMGSIDGGYVLLPEYSKDESNKIIGKKAVKSKTTHTINLANYKSGEEVTSGSYGLVNYSYGTKISNLVVQNDIADDSNRRYNKIDYRHISAYGSVIGTLLGGDSVLDNVKVVGGIAATELNDNADTERKGCTLGVAKEEKAIGALVGEVRAGSITFTNIPRDAVADFEFYSYGYDDNGSLVDFKKYRESISGTDDDKSEAVSKYIGGYIGKIGDDSDQSILLPHVMVWFDGIADAIEDRYVVCKDEITYNGNRLARFPFKCYGESSDKNVYETNNYIYPLRKSTVDNGDYKYSIFNTSYFSELEKADKIVVDKKGSGSSETYEIGITKPKQLYLISLALNTGALSVNLGKYTYSGAGNDEYTNYPYNYKCVNYKSYSENKDTNNPMIIDKYFSFKLNGQASSINTIYYKNSNGNYYYCVLNPIYSYTRSSGPRPGSIVYLIKNDLNMSTIGHFAGLGMREYIDDNTGNNYTNNNNLKSGGNYKYIYTFLASLKGSMTDNVRPKLIIEMNDDIPGQSLGLIPTIYDNGRKNDIAQDDSKSNYNVKNNVYKFTDVNNPITISDLEIQGKITIDSAGTKSSYAGALIGWSNSMDYYTLSNITVDNLNIVSSVKGDIGGLIGKVNNEDFYNNSFKIDNVCVGNQNGSIESYTSEVVTDGSSNYSVALKNTDSSTDNHIGGLIGYTTQVKISNCEVNHLYIGGDNDAGNNSYSGGLLGYYKINTKGNYLENINIKNSRIKADTNSGYQGGVIGCLYQAYHYYGDGSYDCVAANNLNVYNTYIYNAKDTHDCTTNTSYTAQIVGKITASNNNSLSATFALIGYKAEYTKDYVDNVKSGTSDPNAQIIEKVYNMISTDSNKIYDYYEGYSSGAYNTYKGQDCFNIVGNRSRVFIYKNDGIKMFSAFEEIERQTNKKTVVNDHKNGIDKYSENNKNKSSSSEDDGGSGDNPVQDNTVYRNYVKAIATDKTSTDNVATYVFQKGNQPIDLDPSTPGVLDKYLVSWNSESDRNKLVQDILEILTDGQGVMGNNTVTKKYSNVDYNYGNTDRYIHMEVVPMVIDASGNVSEDTSANAAKFEIKNGKTPGVSFNLDNSELKLALKGAIDTVAGEQGNTYGTYALLKVKYVISPEYQVYDTSAVPTKTYESQELVIPFMINNKVDVDIYTQVAVGEYYDASELRKLKTQNLNLTKDSSFTIYEEICYSENRTAFDSSNIQVYYPKAFTLNSTNKIQIPVGTKLTLVDLTNIEGVDGVAKEYKTYYYKIPDDNNAYYEIPLEWFKSGDKEEGRVNFIERIISKIDNQGLKNQNIKSMFNPNYEKKNVGVEKYILFVDVSDIKDKGISDTVVDSGVTNNQTTWKPELVYYNYSDKRYNKTDKNGVTYTQDDSIFKKNVRSYTQTTTYSGRDIQFDAEINEEGNKEKTADDYYLISKNQTIQVNETFHIKADDTYWRQIVSENSLKDYANQNKYLEIAVSLIDKDGNKVLLPQGTRISFDGGDNYENIKTTSNIYYYKDGATLKQLYDNKKNEDLSGKDFTSTDDNGDELEEYYYYVNEPYTGKSGNVNTDGFLLSRIYGNLLDIPVSFKLDFQYAKLESLTSNEYSIRLELVRSSEKNYPMGSEVLDTMDITGYKVIGNSQYGLSITPGTDSTSSKAASADDAKLGTTVSKEDLSFNKAEHYSEEYSSGIKFNYTINLTSGYSRDLVKDKKVYLVYRLLKKDKSTGKYSTYNLTTNNSVTVLADGLTAIKDNMRNCKISSKYNGLNSFGNNRLPYTGSAVNGINIPDITFGSSFHKINAGNNNKINSDAGYSIMINNVPSSQDPVLRIPMTLTLPQNADCVNYKLEVMMYSEDDLKANFGSDQNSWKSVNELVQNSVYYSCYDYVIFNLSDIQLE